MATSVITVNRDTKPGYYPIFYGMWLTLRNMLETLFVKGRSATIEYPEKKRNISTRYRGVHLLTAREDGTPKCVACYMCATVCPAECIYIEAGERPEKKIEKYPTRFEIDLLRCVFCGFCVDACPEEAIIMSNNYDMAFYNREQSIVGKADLMKPFTVDEGRLGYRPASLEEDGRRASMRNQAFDLVAAAKQGAAAGKRPVVPTAH